MGKSSGSPPSSPDYASIIPLQEQSNINQFNTMLGASRVNSVTPYGSQTWYKPGTYGSSSTQQSTRQAAGLPPPQTQAPQQSAPSSSPNYYDQQSAAGWSPEEASLRAGLSNSYYGTPTESTQSATSSGYQGVGNIYGDSASQDPWTFVQQLSPEQQALYDQDMRIRSSYGNTAEGMLGNIASTYGTPVNYASQLPQYSQINASQYGGPSGFLGEYGGTSGFDGQYSGPNSFNQQYSGPSGYSGSYSGPTGYSGSYGGPTSFDEKYQGPTGFDGTYKSAGGFVDPGAAGIGVSGAVYDGPQNTGDLAWKGPSWNTAYDTRDKAEQALYSRSTRYMDEDYAKKQQQLEDRLLSQGFSMRDTGYREGMDDFNAQRERAYADARDAAIQFGGQEATGELNRGLSAEGARFGAETSMLNQNAQFGMNRANTANTAAGLALQGQIAGANYNLGRSGQANQYNRAEADATNQYGLSSAQLNSNIANQAYQNSMAGTALSGNLANMASQNQIQGAGLNAQIANQAYQNQMQGASLNNQFANQAYQNQMAGTALSGQLANQAYGNQMAGAALNNQFANTTFQNQMAGAGLNANLANQSFQNQQQSNQFNQAEQNRALQYALQNIGVQQQDRARPLNELNAFRTGQQVQLPGTPGQTSVPNMQGIDQIGIANQDYQNQLGAYNAEQAGSNNFMNGMFGLASSWLRGGGGNPFG